MEMREEPLRRSHWSHYLNDDREIQVSKTLKKGLSSQGNSEFKSQFRCLEKIRSKGASSVDKESACNARDPGSIPESERSAGEGIDYPLQYSWASLVAQLAQNPPAM